MLVAPACSRVHLIAASHYTTLGMVSEYEVQTFLLHATTDVLHPWQYAGRYFESSTDFVKFGTRYYNPVWGRWTQQDSVACSLGSPVSLKWVSLIWGVPLNHVDQSGKLLILVSSHVSQEKVRYVKNVRLLIIVLSIAVGLIYLGDFVINRGHSFFELIAIIGLFLIAAMYIFELRRSRQE